MNPDTLWTCRGGCADEVAAQLALMWVYDVDSTDDIQFCRFGWSEVWLRVLSGRCFILLMW